MDAHRQTTLRQQALCRVDFPLRSSSNAGIAPPFYLPRTCREKEG